MTTQPQSAAATSGTVVVLVGPSGSGKTAVGKELAEAIGGVFLDADDFHTPEAKAQMHAGHPLNDAERHPWLERVRAAAEQASEHSTAVLACSALNPELRDFLTAGRATWKFVALDVDPAILRERLAKRQGHFFPAALLDSQLTDWHPLEANEGFTVDGGEPIATVVEEIEQGLSEESDVA